MGQNARVITARTARLLAVMAITALAITVSLPSGQATTGRRYLDPVFSSAMGPSSGAQRTLEADLNPADNASKIAAGAAVSWQEQIGMEAGDPPIAVFQAVDDPYSPFGLAETMCEQDQLLGNVCEMNLY